MSLEPSQDFYVLWVSYLENLIQKASTIFLFQFIVLAHLSKTGKITWIRIILHYYKHCLKAPVLIPRAQTKTEAYTREGFRGPDIIV